MKIVIKSGTNLPVSPDRAAALRPAYRPG
jgi:hypothetical protein